MSETMHDPQQDYIASLEAENERLHAEMGYHEAKDVIAQLNDQVTVLRTENEREKKRVEVYRIAGEQAMAQVDDLRAQLAESEKAAYDVNGTIEALKQQLTASVPLAEHNRIVGETVKSLDAERTEFEERIAAITAEADSHARLAVDVSQQLTAVLGIFSDHGEPLPTLEQCRERWDGLKQQLTASEARVKELEGKR